MQAYQYERFTVTHNVSEYHYTLYYYDQAGNLLKTVPPEGVHANYDSVWLDNVAAARAADMPLTPSHGLLTQYRYNTLNQVVRQQTPDAGQSRFWYDRLGRLAVSQNARQYYASGAEPGRQYSYTLYDGIGRITEVGQINNQGSAAMTDSISRIENNLSAWLGVSAAGKEQITTTVYDTAYAGFTGLSFTPVVQRNLRNRVAYTSYTAGANPAQYNQGTFYTYDIEGNVDTLLQDYGSSSFGASKNVMNLNGNRFKRIVYQYDLVSGKVNNVAYQPHQVDAFYHRYTYDAENRLILSETSQDSVFWDKDARYEYYKHGPLARELLGDKMVQGKDYAYTLQGWLKGINSTTLSHVYDMGRDGDTTLSNRYVARDAYGFSLNYFAGDYAPIGAVAPFPGMSARLDTAYRPLYNGNISSMAVNVGPLYRSLGQTTDNSHWRGPLLYNYRYDQLNRITGMDAYRGLNQASNNWDSLIKTADFKERVDYDGNGNIKKYLRNNFGETGLPMDSLGYRYIAGTNKLERILDSASDAVGGGYDLHNQPVSNYAYDSIGNLIRDSIENISAIKWNVYGKIIEIDHRTTTLSKPTKNIYYYYDAAGHRIGKKVTRGDTTAVAYTWYVRDASGNVMATYTANLDSTKVLDSADLKVGEKHIYGSSRLGILTAGYSTDANTNGLSIYTSPWTGVHLPYYSGQKQYELSNHLGNVLATITDKKIGVSLADSSLIDHYEADVQTAQDYYPFGMVMPGRMFTALSIPGGSISGQTQVNGYTVPVDLALNSRSGNEPTQYAATRTIDLEDGFTSSDNDDVTAYLTDTTYKGTANIAGDANGVGGSSKYRYGFNGKENDNEVKGVGNELDFGARTFDPRLGRFLSIDPLGGKFPFQSAYVFAANSPIKLIDYKGLEAKDWIKSKDAQGNIHYKWDANVTGAGNTPHGYEYVGNSYRYHSQDRGNVNLWNNGTWSTFSAIGASGEPPVMEGPSSGSAPVSSVALPSSQATVGMPNTRARYSDFEYGMITSPATHATIGLMVPGYNLALGGATLYQGIQNKDPLQIGFGVLGIAAEGIGYYGRVSNSSAATGGSRNINPKGGNMNCAGCSIAGDATLKGRPASAINHGATSTAAVASEYGSTWIRGQTAATVSNQIQSLGNGATGIIFGSRGTGQIGHFFNVVNKEGSVQFLDFQKAGSAVMSSSELGGYQSLWFLNTTGK